MLLLNRKDIKSVFTMEDAIEADKLAFQLVAEGKIDLPLRTVIEAEKYDGEFVFMPAYSPDFEASTIKIINNFPHNIDKGLISGSGQIMLCDGKTGYVLAALDGTYVTQLRTGASSGAAYDLLAKKNCRIGGMIGTGGQAATQLEGMLCARKLEEVRVYDMNQDRCEQFCAKMQRELEHYGAKIIPVQSSTEAAIEADLFTTITPSSKPVFDGAKIKHGATVSCVGTYQPHKHEMDPALLPRASKIFCDYEEAVLSESGDLLIPLADGLITRSAITGSLGNVVNGTLTGRENDDEIIVYETVGIAAQDLVVAKMIYDRAVDSGVGQKWE